MCCLLVTIKQIITKVIMALTKNINTYVVWAVCCMGSMLYGQYVVWAVCCMGSILYGQYVFIMPKLQASLLGNV